MSRRRPQAAVSVLLGVEGLFFLVLVVLGLGSAQQAGGSELGAIASLYLAALFAAWAFAPQIEAAAKAAQAMICASYLVNAVEVSGRLGVHPQLIVTTNVLRMAGALLLLILAMRDLAHLRHSKQGSNG